MIVPFTRRTEALVFALVFGTAAYFYNGFGWNQTARYDAIWAFVEPGPNRGTFRIDDFLDAERNANTGDFAHNPAHSPHYYSNKAPGTSLLGVPAYLALFHGERALGVDPLSAGPVLLNAYLIHLWVTVLPVALSAVFFLRLALRLTEDHRRAIVLTLGLYGATLVLPFSTSLWGHPTAAAFVVMALAYHVVPGTRGALGSGLFAGLATLTDYGCAPFALSLVVAGAISTDRVARLKGLVSGALGPVIVFGAYHWALFGSPFALASSFSAEGMVDDQHMLGLLGSLNGSALWGLTVSPYRGLLVYMPVLALALVAMRDIRLAERRSLWWLMVANLVVCLVLNVSFNGWHGGNAAGPRYQIVALPFYFVLLARLPRTRLLDAALYATILVSFANMFVLTAASPITSGRRSGSELLFDYEKLWRAARVDLGWDAVPPGSRPSRGSIHNYPDIPMREHTPGIDDPALTGLTTFNLGERLLGLNGVLSLVPALAWILACTLLLLRAGAPAHLVPNIRSPASPNPGAT